MHNQPRFGKPTALAALALLLGCVLWAAGGQTPYEGTARELDWAERLARLSPDQPDAYFTLAEEAMDRGLLDEAARLFVLSAHLSPDALGSSSCLALAEVERRRGRGDFSRILTGMARMYGPSMNESPLDLGLSIHADQQTLSDVPARITACLGFYRRGEGARALNALELDPAVEAVIARYERTLRSVLAEVINWCRNHPRCEVCHNEVVQKCPACHGGADPGHCTVCDDRDFILCPSCGGRPGPLLSADRERTLLQIEVALMAGTGATWSQQLTLDVAQPRSVLDPSQVPAFYGIDPDECVYRDGHWSAPAAGNTVESESDQ